MHEMVSASEQISMGLIEAVSLHIMLANCNPDS